MKILNFINNKMSTLNRLKRTIVLDLDETLIKSIPINHNIINMLENDPNYSFLKGRTKIVEILDIIDNGTRGQGDSSAFIIVFRPYLKEFIEFIVNNVDEIVVFSAAVKRYIYAVVYAIFDQVYDKYSDKFNELLTNIYTRINCEITPEAIVKDLGAYGFNLAETFTIDDTHTTFMRNKKNAIFIPKYSPIPEDKNWNADQVTLLNIKSKINDYNDDCLLHIVNYLRNNLRKDDDIRVTDMSKCFYNGRKSI